ncbi:MAG: transposase domain-containing protein [Candidatus Zhuqueibacterota bacterium]
MFAGSHDGVIYSLVATAKKHGVEPFAWLNDALARIAHCPVT